MNFYITLFGHLQRFSGATLMPTLDKDGKTINITLYTGKVLTEVDESKWQKLNEFYRQEYASHYVAIEKPKPVSTKIDYLDITRQIVGGK